MAIDLKKPLMKADRFAAWLLVGIMIAFFVSGYGLTQNIMPEKLAKFLHDSLLPVVGGLAFGLHSAYGMHIAFKRWRIWGPIAKWALIVYFLVLVTGLGIFQYHVWKPSNNVPVPQVINLD